MSLSPPSSPDTTVKLWDYLYLIRIPELQSRSLEDIKKYGVRVTGIKSVDDDAGKRLMTRYASVAEMVKFFRDGIPVRLVEPSDAKTIYEDITLHIHSWKDRLEKGINIHDAPVDDLIAMDQFAHTVYEHAKYQFTKDYVDSILGHQLANISNIGPTNFFQKTAMNKDPNVKIFNDKTVINSSETEEEPPRDSLADFFKERLINLRRY